MSTTATPAVPARTFVKGFKFPCYPTEEQKVLLAKTFGSCRYVYNRALKEAVAEYEYYLAHRTALPSLKPPRCTGYDFVNKGVSYKADPASLWLNEVSAVAIQQSMLHLGLAYSRFFKERKGYPRTKSKHDRQSFTLMPNAFQMRGRDLYIAKSTKVPLKVIFSRELPSAPSQITISKTPSGKYYVSFLCEYVPEPQWGTGRIGIDLGLKDFLVASDGSRVPNPKHLTQCARQLRRAQQDLSRCKKGSRNRTKARLKVAQIHERIRNTRTDFQHKLSRRLVNENQVIGLEKLMVKGMVRNRHLSKAISDAAWRSFTDKLDYKSREAQHCTLVYMDSFFPSSHLCSVTHQRLDRKLSLSERVWLCPHCGLMHDRDLNAAQNIEYEALDVLARQGIDPSISAIVLATTKH